MKNELERLRQELDSLNLEIATNVERRLQLMEKVSEHKKKLGLQLFDESRENEMFEDLKERFGGKPTFRHLQTSMETIFKESFKYLKNISLK